MKEIVVNNISETKEFAKSLAKKLHGGDIICLEGDLGVGKSVIARTIGIFFGVKKDIPSPTFNILKSYEIKSKEIKKINHFDLYRIKNIEELYNIGFEDYIYDKNTLNIIEWPEIAYEILPKSIIKIFIKRVGDTKRNISIN